MINIITFDHFGELIKTPVPNVQTQTLADNIFRNKLFTDF